MAPLFTTTRAWLTYGLLCLAAVDAKPAPKPKPGPKVKELECLAPPINIKPAPRTKPLKRKEWRTLTRQEKSNYLTAVDCILNKPALTTPFADSGVLSRYDDLVYTHIQQTMSIHYTGHFLPWHRYMVAVYEDMLRDECGYKGAQPYWDWSLDTPARKWADSPVFDAVTGFGGNGAAVPSNPNDPFAVPGATGGGCVVDGHFAGRNDMVHLGPMNSTTLNPQCLRRGLSPYFAGRYLGKNQTALTLKARDFGSFARIVEGGPSFEMSGVHGGGHYSVGGQMGDLYASPSDPLFYLHHANLDRVWWSWQKKDKKRLKDISGPIFMMDYANAQGGNVTLKFPLSMGVSADDVKVGDVMDINACGKPGGVLCYEYDKLY
ncbi:hypothetical protein QBC39DRAFT_380303 [Podospora conica]|nr:hypothetical protein QBC39DRAFT_380303 [Schizothecium conicum]